MNSEHLVWFNYVRCRVGGGVNLRKYKQRNRLRIVQGGSFTCNTG